MAAIEWRESEDNPGFWHGRHERAQLMAFPCEQHVEQGPWKWSVHNAHETLTSTSVNFSGGGCATVEDAKRCAELAIPLVLASRQLAKLVAFDGDKRKP